MAKQTGLGARAFVQGIDISGEVNAIGSITSTQELLDVTTIDKSATARLPGREDGSIAFNAWFDPGTLPLAAFPPSSDALHVPYAWTSAAKLPTGQRGVMVQIAVSGTPALSDAVAMLQARQSNFDVQRQPGNALACTATFQADGAGIVWGKALTAGMVTHASAASGTSIDDAAASSAGAIAMVQARPPASGTATPVIQDSADDSSFAAITGMTFTAVANTDAPTAQLVQSSATQAIRRYVRVASTGTFTNFPVAMAYRRN